jgi:hypothetical protein
MLLENLISFRYSRTTFPNTIMWIQAKAKKNMPTTTTANLNNAHAFTFSQEFTLLYLNSHTFIKHHQSGALHKQMSIMKQFMHRIRSQQIELN